MHPSRWLAVLLAVLLVSGHTAGLQVVAWAGMTLERAQTMSWSEALRSSLDGSHPCGICRAVDALAKAPQAPGVTQPKPDMALPEAPVALIAPSPAIPLPALEVAKRLHEWHGDVPTPPPQAL